MAGVFQAVGDVLRSISGSRSRTGSSDEDTKRDGKPPSKKRRASAGTKVSSTVSSRRVTTRSSWSSATDAFKKPGDNLRRVKKRKTPGEDVRGGGDPSMVDYSPESYKYDLELCNQRLDDIMRRYNPGEPHAVVDSLRRELASALEKIATLNEELQILEKSKRVQITNLTRQLAAEKQMRDSDRDRFQKQVAALKRELAKLQAKYDKVVARLRQAESEGRQLKKRVEELEIALAESRRETQAERAETALLRKKLQAMERTQEELARAHREALELERTNYMLLLKEKEQLARELYEDALRKKEEQWLELRMQLQKKLERAELRAAKLAADKQALSLELARMSASLDSLKKSLEEHTRNGMDSEERDSLEDELQEMRKLLAAAHKEHALMQVSYKQMSNEKVDLQHEIERLKKHVLMLEESLAPRMYTSPKRRLLKSKKPVVFDAISSAHWRRLAVDTPDSTMASPMAGSNVGTEVPLTVSETEYLANGGIVLTLENRSLFEIEMQGIHLETQMPGTARHYLRDVTLKPAQKVKVCINGSGHHRAGMLQWLLTEDRLTVSSLKIYLCDSYGDRTLLEEVPVPKSRKSKSKSPAAKRAVVSKTTRTVTTRQFGRR